MLGFLVLDRRLGGLGLLRYRLLSVLGFLVLGWRLGGLGLLRWLVYLRCLNVFDLFLVLDRGLAGLSLAGHLGWLNGTRGRGGCGGGCSNTR